MAIKPSVVYPGQIAVDPNYPEGAAQNITVSDDGTGTPLEKTWINDLWGFEQALLAEAGLTPSGTPDRFNDSQYLAGVKAAALNAQHVNVIGTPISLDGFLGTLGVYCTSQVEIQAANDYFVANLIRGTIHLPPNSVIGVTSVITLDTAYTSMHGHRSVLVASGIAPGAVALKLEGSVAPSLAQTPAVIKDFSILGPATSGSVGIDFRNSAYGANGPSGIVVENVNLKSFGLAAWFGPAEYPISLRDCGAYECDTALDFNTYGTGAVSVSGGIVKDCDQVVDMVYNARYLSMHDVEMKDCLKLFSVAGGKVEMFGCRARANDYLVIPITISGAGGSVVMHGGELRLEDPAPSAFSRWVDAGAGSYFHGRGVRLRNTLTSSGAFGSGDGVVSLRETQIDDPATECTLLHNTRSMVADGGFEEAGLVDDIFITDSTTSSQIDRYNSGGTSLLATSGDARSGSQSLGYSKAGGAAVASAFALACVPVRPFDRIGGEFYVRKPAGAAMTTTVDFNYTFVRLGVNENGVPRILHREDMDTGSLILTGADSGWVQQSFGDVALTAPGWATHFVVEVEGTAWPASGETMFFDDLNVNIIG